MSGNKLRIDKFVARRTMIPPNLVLVLTLLMPGDGPTSPVAGTVVPSLGDQSAIPSRYRLKADEFKFELALKRDLPASGLEIHILRFPSAVTSATPENNMVYAE